MVSLVLLVATTICTCAGHVKAGDFVPYTLCATLFSSEGVEGDSFVLTDFDQSVNLQKDYRHSVNGWPNTSTVRLENNCRMTMCNDTYFTGTCQSITARDQDETLELLISALHSVNCTCKKTCSCDHISIPKDNFANGLVGRAYVNGDCATCNAEYINLYKEFTIPEAIKESVNTFIIPDHCNITVYQQPNFKGNQSVLPGPVYQGFQGTVGSYEIYCDEEPLYDTRSLSELDAERPMISIPANSEALLQMLYSNDTLVYHAGLQAAFKSAANGRSSRNAYIVIIGDIQPYWLGFPQCKNGPWNSIGECRIPVEMNILGICGELRVITVPIGFNSSVDDFELMATLNEYLRTHEELSEVIPNAVIMYHWLHDQDFAEEDSKFQRRLHTVHQLRARLLDESYSNLVFLMNYLNALSDPEERRNPEDRLALFEQEITMQWAFPDPVTFCVKTGIRAQSLFVNGHVRMENDEYFPRNLEVSLDRICDNGGDPLGRAIFRAAFLDNKTPRFSVEPEVYEVAAEGSKAAQNRDTSSASPSQRAVLRTLTQVQWKLKIHDLQHLQEIDILKLELAAQQKSG